MSETVGMVLDRIEQKISTALPLRPVANSLDFLRAVYRDPTINLQIRIRCAIACLPFELPKLAVTAVVNEQNFAELLDRRLKRIAEITNQKTINGNPHEIEVKPPMPRLSDRRYRRM
jgi:hypothetical protein